MSKGGMGTSRSRVGARWPMSLKPTTSNLYQPPPVLTLIQSLNPRIPTPPEVRLTLPDAAVRRSGRGEDEMSAAVKITLRDHTATDLRAFAAKCRDAMQSRRLLAIALILDGATRLEAARATGMDRQTLRDWVHHYNEAGLSGLISRSPPGPRPRLTEAQMAELRELVVAAPDPKKHQVVRWRCVDVREEVSRRFSVTVGERTIGKWLRKLKLTGCSHVRFIPKRMRRRSRLLKKLQCHSKASAARQHCRNPRRDLVSGRSPGRTERHTCLCVGAAGLAAADGAGQPSRHRLPVRCDLSCPRRWRRHYHARSQ